MHVLHILADMCSNYKFNSEHVSVQEYLCHLNFMNLCQDVIVNYGGSQKHFQTGKVYKSVYTHNKNSPIHNIYSG